MKIKITGWLVLFVCFLATTNEVKAQDPQYSQFYNAPLHLNPAMMGVYPGSFRAAVIYRDQWASILSDRPYRTIGASFDMRFHIAGDDYVSAGINLMRDEAGSAYFNQSTAHIGAAYMKQLGGNRYSTNDQYLIAGAQFGFGQHSLDWDKLWFSQQFDYNSNLPNPDGIGSGESIPGGSGLFGNSADGTSTLTYTDFNAGLLYYALFGENTSIYAGASLAHLNSPRVSFFDDSDDVLYMRWTGHVGGEFPFSDEFSFLPALYVRGQGPSLNSMFGGNVRYSNHDWNELAIRAGLWSRLTNKLDDGNHLDALIVSAILEVESWNLGFSYDVNISNLNDATNSRGAFEVALIYVHPDRSRRYKVNCPKF